MDNLKKLGLMAIVLTLAACSSDDNARVQEPDSQPKQIPENQYQKPSAPIQMRYEILTQAPQIGDDVEIQVTFDSPFKSLISTNMAAQNELQLLNSEKSWQVNANKTGVYEALPSLKVRASSNGLFYLTLVASIEIDGVVQSKPFVIPIEIGNGEKQQKIPGNIQVDENGQKLVIQQAETKS